MCPKQTGKIEIMSIFKAIAGIVAAALIAGSVHAAPIDIFETADFSEDPTAGSPIGTLDFAVNKIGGSIDVSAFDIIDAWSADVVIGGPISDVVVHIVGLTGGTGVAIFGNGSDFDTFTPIFGDGFFAVDLATGGDFFDDFVMAADTGAPSFEYTWFVTVESDSSVPAPAGLLMLFAGLALIGLGKTRS